MSKKVTPQAQKVTPCNAQKVTPCNAHLGNPTERRDRKKKYDCNYCNYSTKIISNYKKHCNSKKHLKKSSQMDKKSSQMDKKSSHYLKILQENVELKEQLKDQRIQHLEETVVILKEHVGKPGTSNSHNNTTNSHNTNHISINMYLSEHCQDAMNLDDFVNKIKFKLKDVFDGNLPIENPVQKVFIQKLEDLDPTKRPVHCTDTRRGKFMVNDKNEGWIEDTGAKIAAGVKRVQSKAFVDAFQAFDAEYKPPHPGKIQDKKDSIVNPIRNNVTQKGTNKIIKEVANAMNIKDAISQLEKEPKSKDDL